MEAYRRRASVLRLRPLRPRVALPAEPAGRRPRPRPPFPSHPLPWPRSGPRRASVLRSLFWPQFVEAEILVVQLVRKLVPLGHEVATVLGVGRYLDRHLLHDRQAVALQPADLLRVVRQDPDRRQAQVGEDLVADPPVPCIGGEAELEVRLDGVEAVFLELIGLQLVEQTDS